MKAIRAEMDGTYSLVERTAGPYSYSPPAETVLVTLSADDASRLGLHASPVSPMSPVAPPVPTVPPAPPVPPVVGGTV